VSGSPPLGDPPPLKIPPGVFARIRRPEPYPRHGGDPSSWRLALLLFLLTVLSTLGAGYLLTAEGVEAVSSLAEPLSAIRVFFSGGLLAIAGRLFGVFSGGWPYSLSILAFFFAHEMGHYLACRYYKVSSTLPLFIPAPPGLVPFGTFGALMRIRQRIPHRRALFDIGVAGPLAGFVVAVPILAIGIMRSEVLVAAEPVAGQGYIGIGSSALTRFLEYLLLSDQPPGTDLVADPVYLAGWLGLLATTMNLIPAGQLDGGHVTFALFQRWHGQISIFSGVFLAALVVAYGISGQVSAWTLWCVLVLFFFRRHPPVLDDGQPLGRGRMVVAGLAALILLLCFMPHPISVHGL